ncbi:MAG: hypothetical protein HZA07_00155 [Nitrospirae bacterium]|nr:hypothetical protein [Nitrospirota bacterium]
MAVIRWEIPLEMGMRMKSLLFVIIKFLLSKLRFKSFDSIRSFSMRYWKTIDGKYLVEAATDDLVDVFDGYKFRSPSGKKIDYGYQYYLQDSAGQIIAIYKGPVGSFWDVLSVTTYIVIGNALHSWCCTKQDGEPKPAIDSIVMEGLEPIDPSELPFNITLQEALRTYEEGQVKRLGFLQKRKKEMLSSPDQLPDLEGMTDLDAVVECPSPYGNLTVRISDIEVWKESITCGGKERPGEIESILKAKYGSRLRSFTSMIPNYLYGT